MLRSLSIAVYFSLYSYILEWEIRVIIFIDYSIRNGYISKEIMQPRVQIKIESQKLFKYILTG